MPKIGIGRQPKGIAVIGDPIDTSAVPREHRCATCSTFYNSGYGEKWKELRKDGGTDRRTFGDRAKLSRVSMILSPCVWRRRKKEKKRRNDGKREDTRKRSHHVAVSVRRFAWIKMDEQTSRDVEN